MIIFKELILENFGPYKGKNIIDLSPQNNANNKKDTPMDIIKQRRIHYENLHADFLLNL